MSKLVYAARKKLLLLNQHSVQANDSSSAILWPQWTDQDQTEKWTTKGLFEDADNLPLEPEWYMSTQKEWKRPQEFITDQTPVVVSLQPTHQPGTTRPPTESRNNFDSIGSQQISEGFHHDSAADAALKETSHKLAPVAVNIEAETIVGPAQLIYSGIKLVTQLSNHKLVSAPHTCIYPKAKDGQPLLNSCGKYAVKLFWMGAWRRVIVDDKIPFDKSGNCLFEVGDVKHEIYHLLLAKAIYKVTAHLQGLGDFDLFTGTVYALTGCLMEKQSCTSELMKHSNCIFIGKSVDGRSFFHLTKTEEIIQASDLSTTSNIEFNVINVNDVLFLKNEFTENTLGPTYVFYNIPQKAQRIFVSSFDAEKVEPQFYQKSFLLQITGASAVGFASDYIHTKEKPPRLNIYSLKGDLITSVNAYGCSCICLQPESVKEVYRLVAENVGPFSIQTAGLDSEIVLKDEASASDLLVDSFHDVDCQPQNLTANTWCILSKTLLNVVQPVSVTAQIFIAGDLYGTYVRIIDNDTSREIQSDSFEIRNMVLEPNKHGYNIIADCRPLVDLATAKLKIRFSGAPMLPEISVLLPTPTQLQQIEDAYRHNKRGLVFRYYIGNRNCNRNFISADAKFVNTPQARIKLQLLHGSDVIAETDYNENPVIMSALLLGQDPSSPNSTSNDGMKKKAPSQADPLTVQAALTAISATTKRYAIQGFLEHHDQFRSLCPETDRLKQRALAQKSMKPGEAPVAGGPSLINVSAAGVMWKLRFSSTETASLDITKDTEQDDRFKKVKDQWEQKQPGRISKARESREQFYKGKADDKPSAAVPIVSLEYIKTMQTLPDYKTFVTNMRDTLSHQKEGLQVAKTTQFAPFLQLSEQNKQSMEVELNEKTQYQKMVREFKETTQAQDRERQLAEEMQKAAEAEAAAAAQKAEEEATKKSGKKGKK